MTWIFWTLSSVQLHSSTWPCSPTNPYTIQLTFKIVEILWGLLICKWCMICSCCRYSSISSRLPVYGTIWWPWRWLQPWRLLSDLFLWPLTSNNIEIYFWCIYPSSDNCKRVSSYSDRLLIILLFSLNLLGLESSVFFNAESGFLHWIVVFYGCWKKLN